MNKVYILDNTLRDGGYINDFKFGEKCIRDIINRLACSGIDIIECGFLDMRRDMQDYDSTIFGSIGQIQELIEKKNVKYVVMCQCKDFVSDRLPNNNGEIIDGIRLSFHKHEIDNALEFGREIIRKGYMLFLQPIAISTYDHILLKNLINEVNDMSPYAFYIVDTFGALTKKHFVEMLQYVDNLLYEEIALGIHLHDNLKEAIYNLYEFLDYSCIRERLIDASVSGLGRCAGNLETENVARLLNSKEKCRYDVSELDIIEKSYIEELKRKKLYGYDECYRISAELNCHPMYSNFLKRIERLSRDDLFFLIKNISKDERELYNEEYIIKMVNEYLG